MKRLGYSILATAWLANACQTKRQLDSPHLSPELPASHAEASACDRWLVSQTGGKSVLLHWSHPELPLNYEQQLVITDDNERILILIDELGHRYRLSNQAGESFACTGHKNDFCFWFISPVDSEPRLELRLVQVSQQHYVLASFRQLQDNDTSSFPRAWLSPHFSDRDLLEEDIASRQSQLNKSAERRAWLHYQRCKAQQARLQAD
ncbi:MAG: hypothetical protein ACOH5I_10205 [Oligoflexus sp.]